MIAIAPAVLATASGGTYGADNLIRDFCPAQPLGLPVIRVKQRVLPSPA